MRPIPAPPAALLATLLFVAACASDPTPSPAPRPGEAPPTVTAPQPAPGRVLGALPAEVTLALGDTTTLDGGALTVRFVDVVSDSRCPAAAHCVRAGEAEVDVELRTGGETATLRLGTPSPTTRVADGALGYAVELVDLHPVPRTTQPLDEGEYRLRLHVARLEER